MNPGWSCQERTNVNDGPPSATAFSTRSTYVSTDIPDQ
jgi:hypothetical protein